MTSHIADYDLVLSRVQSAVLRHGGWVDHNRWGDMIAAYVGRAAFRHENMSDGTLGLTSAPIGGPARPLTGPVSEIMAIVDRSIKLGTRGERGRRVPTPTTYSHTALAKAGTRPYDILGHLHPRMRVALDALLAPPGFARVADPWGLGDRWGWTLHGVTVQLNSRGGVDLLDRDSRGFWRLRDTARPRHVDVVADLHAIGRLHMAAHYAWQADRRSWAAIDAKLMSGGYGMRTVA